jgi:RNA polymerase sigma-70 factor (ECF subfamily)
MAVQKLNGESLSEDFVVFIQKRASRHAASLMLCGIYPWQDRDDLQQDLLLDLLQRLRRFSESLGNPRAFAYLVIKNRASVLATRKLRRFDSLDAIICGDDENGGSRARFQEPEAEDFARTSDIKIEVRRVLDRLPSPERALARNLGSSMTVPEICALTGKSRSGIYKMIGKMRSSFIEQGLKPETRKRTRRENRRAPGPKRKKS